MTRASGRSDELRARSIAFVVALVSVFLATSLTLCAAGWQGSLALRETFLIRGVADLYSAVGLIPPLVSLVLLLAASVAALTLEGSTRSLLLRILESLTAGFLLAVLLGSLSAPDGGTLGLDLGRRLAHVMSAPIAAALCGVTALLALWLVI